MKKRMILIPIITLSVFVSSLLILSLLGEKEAIPSSDVDIKSNLAYVSNSRGIKIYKIAEELNGRKITEISLTETAFGLSIVNDLLYVSGGFGIKIFDLSEDPENPSLLGEYNKGGGSQICINNSLAYLTFHNNGLEIINVQDSSDPTFLSQYSQGNRVTDVEVVDNIIYLAMPDKGLEVVNGSDNSNPQYITSLPLNGAWDIWRFNNLLYLGCHWNGVRIIDISIPSAPRIIGEFQSDGDVYALAGDGELLYVGNFYGRIEVLNITKPDQPTLLARTQEDYSSHGMYHDGTYAYLVGHHTQFSILKYDIKSSTLRFYCEVSTKSTTWEIILMIPGLLVVHKNKKRMKKYTIEKQ